MGEKPNVCYTLWETRCGDQATGRCTTAATVCMVSRTVCDRFKHRPQRYRTKAGKEKGETAKGIRSFLSRLFSLAFSLFSLHFCVRIVVNAHRKAHKGRSSFLISLSVSLPPPPPPFPREEREREREREGEFLQGREIYEQIVRCEGCIIVRIIRTSGREG